MWLRLPPQLQLYIGFQLSYSNNTITGGKRGPDQPSRHLREKWISAKIYLCIGNYSIAVLDVRIADFIPRHNMGTIYIQPRSAMKRLLVIVSTVTATKKI